MRKSTSGKPIFPSNKVDDMVEEDKKVKIDIDYYILIIFCLKGKKVGVSMSKRPAVPMSMCTRKKQHTLVKRKKGRNH